METQDGLKKKKSRNNLLEPRSQRVRRSLQDHVNQERTFPRSGHLHMITASYIAGTPTLNYASHGTPT